MKAFLFFLIFTSTAFLTQTVAFGRDGNGDVSDLQTACAGLGLSLAEVKDQTVLCVTTWEDAANADNLPLSAPTENDDNSVRKPDLVYLNSGGGNAIVAMDIGKVVHRLRLPIVLHEKCLDECASYILPAARRNKVSLVDNPVIVFGAGAHRTQAEFSIARLKDAGIEMLDSVGKPTVEWLRSRKAAQHGFEEYWSAVVLKEVQYFNQIGKKEDVVRLDEARLLTRVRGYETCRVGWPARIVAGNDALWRLKIGLEDEFSPQLNEEIVMQKFLAEFLQPKYNYFFDLEAEPFFISGVGPVSPAQCASELQGRQWIGEIAVDTLPTAPSGIE